MSFIVGGTVPDIVMFIQNCSASLAMVTVPEKLMDLKVMFCCWPNWDAQPHSSARLFALMQISIHGQDTKRWDLRAGAKTDCNVSL